MSSIKPNARRANLAILFVWISAAVAIIALMSSTFKYKLLTAINEGDIYTEGILQSTDLREQIISIAQIIIAIVSAVYFIMWFRRAYFNLSQKSPFLSFTDATAVWGWFVPLFNLYKPYQMMKEMFVQTADLFKHYDINPRQSLRTGILGLWWFLWIVSKIFTQIDMRTSLHSQTLDDLIYSTQIGIVNNALLIPLSVVTAIFMRNYTNNELLLLQAPDKEYYNDSNVATEYIIENPGQAIITE